MIYLYVVWILILQRIKNEKEINNTSFALNNYWLPLIFSYTDSLPLNVLDIRPYYFF